MMEDYTDIYILGCSYMHSYGNWAELKHREGMIHELSRAFTQARITNLASGGSSLSNHERVLIDTVLKNRPARLLLVWGLTFWYRFELPHTYLDNRSEIINYNHGNASAKQLSNEYVGQHFRHITDNASYYMHRNAQKITTMTGWLRSLGHNYLIFNTADDQFADYIHKNAGNYQHLLRDPDIISLTDFFLNDYLYDNGATPEPGDYEIVRSYRRCHYGSGRVAGQTEVVEQIQSKLIIDHFTIT
jgi:hypothetical protein